MKSILTKTKIGIDAKSAAVLIMVSLMLISACGSSDTKITGEGDSPVSEDTQVEQDDDKEPSSSEPASEPAPSSDSGTESSNSDPEQNAFSFSEPSLTFTETYEGSQGALGSGCVPQPGELPDGIWFGVVQEKTTDSITFDLACYYVGELAQQKSSEQGQGEVINDFYISNQNPTVFDLQVDQQALVHEIQLHNENASAPLETIDYAEWPSDNGKYLCWAGDGIPCFVWVAINDGHVTEIVEQYLP